MLQPKPSETPFGSNPIQNSNQFIPNFWKVGKRTGCTWSITLLVVTECSLNRNREQTSCCFCREFDMNWVQNEFAATNQVLNLLLHVINRNQNKFATTNRVLNLLHVLIAENTVAKQKHGLKKQLDIPQILSHINSRAEPLYLVHFFLACFHLRRINFFWPKKRSVLQRDRDIGGSVRKFSWERFSSGNKRKNVVSNPSTLHHPNMKQCLLFLPKGVCSEVPRKVPGKSWDIVEVLVWALGWLRVGSRFQW